jgi:hypothetical protein
LMFSILNPTHSQVISNVMNNTTIPEQIRHIIPVQVDEQETPNETVDTDPGILEQFMDPLVKKLSDVEDTNWPTPSRWTSSDDGDSVSNGNQSNVSGLVNNSTVESVVQVNNTTSTNLTNVSEVPVVTNVTDNNTTNITNNTSVVTPIDNTTLPIDNTTTANQTVTPVPTNNSNVNETPVVTPTDNNTVTPVPTPTQNETVTPVVTPTSNEPPNNGNSTPIG